MSRGRWWVVAALSTVALAWTACGGAAASADVRPIDEILDGPITVTDVTDAGAVVRVKTSIDVVCSVVYGADESYGAQSTDPDMGGLPHSDHHAPMRGLEPGLVYHFRLQGTGPDGTVYISDDRTFETLPAAAGSGVPGRNLASAAAGARVVEVSSVFGDSPSWDGANAIDEDARSEWSSAGDGDAAFITVQLAQPSDLSAVGLWTRTMGNSAQISQFRVIVDGDTVLGPFDVPAADRLYRFPVTVTAQRLRFEVVTSSGGNTGAVEIAAYAADD